MIQVSVSAYSGRPPESLINEASHFVGEVAAKCGSRVSFLVGGYQGLMKVIVDELERHRLRAVLVIPVEYEGWNLPEDVVVVRTGMSYKGRNTVLIRSGDLLVALGGGAGSLMEIFAAYGEGKKVLLLTGYGLPTDRIREAYPEGRISERAPKLIEYYEDGSSLGRGLCRAVDNLARELNP